MFRSPLSMLTFSQISDQFSVDSIVESPLLDLFYQANSSLVHKPRKSLLSSSIINTHQRNILILFLMTPFLMSNQARVSQLLESVREFSGLPECRNAARDLYVNLVRRVKLLSPLFEELTDSEQQLDDDAIQGLQSLVTALGFALDLVKSVNEGSKTFQALQIDKTINKFHEVTTQIEEALCKIHYDQFDLPEEVQEQTQLVHLQFKRAKIQMESPDLQLQTDLTMVRMGKEPDPEMVRRLSEKLHLTTLDDLRNESLAIHDMIILAGGGEFESCFDTMSYVLKMINDFVMLGDSETDREERIARHRSPIIPDDFRCPISLELMKDPVIVSTGQTYERSCIQKWLDAGHKTCPKTQMTLLHTTLTPNYVLKSLISLWCDSNGIHLPKSQTAQKTTSECNQTSITTLLGKLTNGNLNEQRAAAGELRLLAKRNADNRICIAENGAIPVLVELLSSQDKRTQEHAVTALLNLSINEANKGIIVSVGAIPEIVDVLKNGSMEARENAAAALFSLSVVDENKVAIGAAGAIPPLIGLLQHGTPRGKKDAATAIFNLCIYQGNKVRAVRAGIVGPLMGLVKDASGGMMDEALAILAIISGHHEGKVAIGQAEPIPVLVEVVRTGSARNRENGVAVLWCVCAGDVECLMVMKEVGGEDVLKELCANGTDRAIRKAGGLLELLQRAEFVEPS